MRILFIVDPLESLGLAGDTTYALMLEAQRRGHEVWTCQIGQLGLEHDDAVAEARPTQVALADEPAHAFRPGAATPIPLESFGCVMMRTGLSLPATPGVSSSALSEAGPTWFENLR